MFDPERLLRLRAIGLAPAILNGLLAQAGEDDDALPMRVVEVQRDALTLHDGAGELPARALPALLQALAGEADALAVGDWVLARRNAHAEHWVHARLPPLTQLARRTRSSHGDSVQRRVLAANVDSALLVMGLDQDFRDRKSVV